MTNRSRVARRIVEAIPVRLLTGALRENISHNPADLAEAPDPHDVRSASGLGLVYGTNLVGEFVINAGAGWELASDIDWDQLKDDIEAWRDEAYFEWPQEVAADFYYLKDAAGKRTGQTTVRRHKIAVPVQHLTDAAKNTLLAVFGDVYYRLLDNIDSFKPGSRSMGRRKPNRELAEDEVMPELERLAALGLTELEETVKAMGYTLLQMAYAVDLYNEGVWGYDTSDDQDEPTTVMLRQPQHDRDSGETYSPDEDYPGAGSQQYAPPAATVRTDIMDYLLRMLVEAYSHEEYLSEDWLYSEKEREYYERQIGAATTRKGLTGMNRRSDYSSITSYMDLCAEIDRLATQGGGSYPPRDCKAIRAEFNRRGFHDFKTDAASFVEQIFDDGWIWGKAPAVTALTRRRTASSLKKDLERLKLSPEDALRLAKACRKATTTEAVDEVLELANTILDGSGVEALQPENAYVDSFYHSTVALYVNMGDTYTGTLLYDTENEEFMVTSWGDFLENWEQEHAGEDEEGEDEEGEDEDYESEEEEDYESEEEEDYEEEEVVEEDPDAVQFSTDHRQTNLKLEGNTRRRSDFIPMPRRTKKLQRWEADVDAALEELLLDFGAEPTSGAMYQYVLETKVGPLELSIRKGTVFSRFEDPAAASTLGLLNLNSYSGKWNFHTSPGHDISEVVDLVKHNLQKVVGGRNASARRADLGTKLFRKAPQHKDMADALGLDLWGYTPDGDFRVGHKGDDQPSFVMTVQELVAEFNSQFSVVPDGRRGSDLVRLEKRAGAARRHAAKQWVVEVYCDPAKSDLPYHEWQQVCDELFTALNKRLERGEAAGSKLYTKGFEEAGGPSSDGYQLKAVVSGIDTELVSLLAQTMVDSPRFEDLHAGVETWEA